MIALLTDFQDSEYAGVVKGVIYSIAPEAKVVDLTHKIRAFDIRQGSYAVYSSCRFFPDNTIFLAAVDPGVGTERKGVIIKSKVEGRTYYVIGPNNGLFSLIEAEKVYGIDESKIKEFKPKNISAISKTFHARDIFAPAAAMLEFGNKPEQFGKEISKAQIKKIIKKQAKVKKNAIEGEIITYDSFGNIITNIKAEQINKKGIKYGEKLKVKINKRRLKLKFLETYGYAKEKEILCLINSAEHLEIAQKNGSAQKVLKVKGGERISVST